MKIALVQQNYHVGNFEGNTQKILQAIETARLQKADLVVFSELAVCGYPPRDFLEFEDFILQCEGAIARIQASTQGIGVVVGAPSRNPQRAGKDLHNSAWLLADGQCIGLVHKTCLPNYDVFDEYRYFEPAGDWNVLSFRGRRLAITICEDIWNLGDNPLYRRCPMDQLMSQSPELMINISASPFDYDHAADRKEVILANVRKYQLPMIYCNTVGSQTEIVFDGGSLACDRNGQLATELKYFEEDSVLVDLETLCRPLAGPEPAPGRWLDKDMRVSKLQAPNQLLDYLTAEKNIQEIHQALLLGIRDYFSKMGFRKAILGSSGGIDSAVVLTLACEALGKDNVRSILMPSEFSSSHSVEDATQLSKNLGNPFDVVPIREVYEAFIHRLQPLFGQKPFDVAEENIQSRVRGTLLMGLANKFSYVLLNTSNKSELATGYGTLYGDMAGGLSVLGDVYKMQIYALARYLNRLQPRIPENILEKAPSAELRPGQKDSDSLPAYEELDQILYWYIERRQGPREIVDLGFSKPLVDRVLRLVNTNEYKRNQFCPIIRVSCKAFGVGRRVPIVGKYLS